MQLELKMAGLLLSGLLSGHAAAATVDILASFRPDPSQPARNVFKNLTPPGNSYCGWAPQYCNESRYSIGFPVDFHMTAALVPGGDDRQHMVFHAPTDRRTITVLHDETGEAENLELRISGIGMMLTWRGRTLMFAGKHPGSTHLHLASTVGRVSGVRLSTRLPGFCRKVPGGVHKERPPLFRWRRSWP